ncbi:MAG: trypsin-like peptidase domain-containing protein [Chloroflexi bacterium]|nr:trypsin-like peptidase domain-containing protein [Chloroflexota bacterium]
MSNLLQQLNDDLAATVEKARRSLVEIHNGRGGAGAGVVVRADGLIVTNAHVIGRRHLQVTLPDKRQLPAQLVAFDRDHDLALLRVEQDGLTPIELGDSKQIKAGEWALAIGHPWGVNGAATGGIVIGGGAEFPEMRGSGREWIAASLHMRPGHSGGALVDSQTRLVGINTMINGPDVGVAVPVDVVKEFLARKDLTGLRDL